MIGKVDSEAQKGKGWGLEREEVLGRKRTEEGILVCGYLWGAVEMRWALSAAGDLNGSSNSYSCGLRVSTAAHAPATRGN